MDDSANGPLPASDEEVDAEAVITFKSEDAELLHVADVPTVGAEEGEGGAKQEASEAKPSSESFSFSSFFGFGSSEKPASPDPPQQPAEPLSVSPPSSPATPADSPALSPVLRSTSPQDHEKPKESKKEEEKEEEVEEEEEEEEVEVASPAKEKEQTPPASPAPHEAFKSADEAKPTTPEPSVDENKPTSDTLSQEQHSPTLLQEPSSITPASSAKVASSRQERHGKEPPKVIELSQEQLDLFSEDSKPKLVQKAEPTHESIKEFAPLVEQDRSGRVFPDHAFTKAETGNVSDIASKWGPKEENHPSLEPKLKVQLKEFIPHTHESTVIPAGQAGFAKSGVGKIKNGWPPKPSEESEGIKSDETRKVAPLEDETSWVLPDQISHPEISIPWRSGSGKIGQTWPPPETNALARDAIPRTGIKAEDVWHPEDGPTLKKSWPVGAAQFKAKARQWPPPTPGEQYQQVSQSTEQVA